MMSNGYDFVFLLGESTAQSICNEVSRIIVDELWVPCVSRYMPKTPADMTALQAEMDFPYAFSAIGMRLTYVMNSTDIMLGTKHIIYC